ncbi:MAG: hypothetical protein ACRCSU_04705 [Paracoccaceae bacterium]
MILALAVLVLVFGGYFISGELARKTYEAERDALLSDPDVKALLAANTERCEGDYTYVWACGVTLRFDRPKESRECSTVESPWFTGTMTFADTSASIESWIWPSSHQFFLPGQGACSENTCASMTLTGANGTGEQYPPPGKPPEPLPASPVWPDFEAIKTYGTWQDGAWASFRDVPVRFFFGQVPMGELTGYSPPVQIMARHPDLPITITLTLPPGQHEQWQSQLETAFSLVSESVVTTDQTAECSKPPKSVRFRLNPYRDDLLRNLRDWRKSVRVANQP